MTNRPFVSFIVPARNDEKVIVRCVEAIQGIKYDQEFFEVVVVDNDSRDNTVTIARATGARVLTLPRVTISMLRNAGARNAKGEFLAFIDADCVIDKSWLAAALHHFKDPFIACVGSYPGIPEETSWVPKAWDVHQRRYSPQQNVDWLPSRAILVSRKAFMEIGGFDESLVTCEDVDFGYRLKQNGYKIISDGQIRSIHFGEPDTISEFFKKEQWRGYSNYRSVLAHGVYWPEIPSLILPIYYLVALVCLPVAIIYGVLENAYAPILINSAVVLLPPLFLSARASVAAGDYGSLLGLAFLYLIYSLARSASLFIMGHHDGKRTQT